jgi:hypothetical protein
MHWRRWINAPLLWLLRSPLHILVSRSTLAISVRGRISGHTYTLPVNYLQNGFTLLILSPRDRTWWRNLRPKAPVTLWLRGQRLQVIAQAITDPADVAKGLLVILRRSPMYQRRLGVALDGRGDPRQKVLLVRVASHYALIRIRLSAIADAAAVTVDSSADEYIGGRIV